MTTFSCRTMIAAPIDVVFDLSLSIDEHLASMASSNERAVDGVTTGRIEFGQDVTWRARHFGIPFQMTSRITALEQPHRFVDEQIRGPFQHFRHEHRFEPAEGGTLMLDEVDFAAPLGPLGRVAELLVLDRYMPKLIAARNRHLKQAAESR